MGNSWTQASDSQKVLLMAFVLFALLTPWLAACFGAVSLSPVQIWDALRGDGQGVISRIVMELRMPRILLALIAGAGLALAGAVLQLATRNPLADPYLFGISSGASFGAICVMTLAGAGFGSMMGPWLAHLSLPVGALLGAGLSVMLVLALSGGGASHQIERILLSGVATSFMFAAFGSLLLYFSEPQAAAAVLFWTLGSFARASWSGLWLPALVVLFGLLILLGLRRSLLALQGGDETAHTLGVPVPRLRLAILLLCSVMTAILVASCGGIGFVGLLVPHIVRMLLPSGQSLLLTALAGGVFMVWVDVLARTLLSNQELPVGVITSAVGSLFFLTLLRRRRRLVHE
ncbi:MAG: iron ABC transporter permease [Shewanella sp.]|nr:iron ABC transporter permease [Shewanella sp.]MCF1432172.1 iron ABC transporter permease [Shewanella sp.]MCF1437620.1 iron ABC transporter permease [Shewanella sp.]MCF1459403.1 iron ABC transporter permease [Shewanella sp.]